MSLENSKENICGKRLISEHQWEELEEKYDEENWYEDEKGDHYCQRDIWEIRNTDRCIWHADVGGKPKEALLEERADRPERLDRAILRGSELGDSIQFDGCRLPYADFSGADLREAEFGDAYLRRANFIQTNLWNANLTSAGLGHADFTEAELANADFTEAFLEHADFTDAYVAEANLSLTYLSFANFTNSHLGGTVLRGIRLDDTAFEDATFEETTDFGGKSGFEATADEIAETKSRIGKWFTSRLRAIGRPFTNHHRRLEQAEIQYRTIQRLKRERDMRHELELEIREKHARRKRALAERRYWDWFKLAFYRWPMGYGEKPTHVVGTSIGVILAAMLAYPHAGGFERTTGSTTAVADLSRALAVPETISSTVGPWLTSFYFSVVTFTTVGYGDLQPATEMGRLLASVESFVGALLMALLVFVLGRRATW